MMSTKPERNKIDCRFCEWAKCKDGKDVHKDSQVENVHPNLQLVSGNRIIGHRIIGDGKAWFAVLDKGPKVQGHTLVISRKHYRDITDMDQLGDFFEGLVNVSKQLKKKLLENKEFDKVYVMSMCEHWNDDEIDGKKDCKNAKKLGKQEKMHTEHLHFHLLPRYGEMRTKDIAMEHFFVRPAGAVHGDCLLKLKELLEMGTI